MKHKLPLDYNPPAFDRILKFKEANSHDKKRILSYELSKMTSEE